jgi:amidase
MAVKHLREADQIAKGGYSYVYGPYREPVLHIEPGDTVVVETEDAFESKLKSANDRPSAVLKVPFLNPQSGPIHVKGAEKGDTLLVRIESIEPLHPGNDAGTTCLIPEFGGLTGTTRTAVLNEPLPEIVKKLRIEDGVVHWSDAVKIPYDPFIGTIGTSPEIEAINSLTPAEHGGNMDVPDVKPGTTLHLPVYVKGALLYLGDCHAAQGDGELCGVAVEHRARVTLSVDLKKGRPIGWPRLENEAFIMTLGSARPLEDAARIAYRELVYWLEAEYGFDRFEAYMLLTQVGRVRLGNMVDPNYTVGASIARRYLRAGIQ